MTEGPINDGGATSTQTANRRSREARAEDAVAEAADRLHVVHGEMVEAVLSGSGLQGVAALAARGTGAPVVIVVPALRVNVLAPPAGLSARELEPLRRYVDERVNGQRVDTPAAITGETAIRAGDDILGWILRLGEQAPSISQREYLHAAALAAVTETAIEEAKLKTSEALRGSLVEELRTRRQLDGGELLRRAQRLGSDLSAGAVALCMALQSDRPRHVAAVLSGEHPGTLTEHCDGRVHALLPAVDGDAETTLASARRVAARLARQGTVGLSGFCADPLGLSDALEEAELVVEVLSQAPGALAEEAMAGTYRLLLRTFATYPDEIRALHQETVGPLVRYDEQYRTDLLGTLRTYLDCDCNTNATAATIFTHRHTVAYRLERIRDLTGLDASRSEDRERLGLGLKAHRIISPRLPR